MEKITTRVIATLSVFLIFLAAILTGWQGTIQINSIAGGITLDSRSSVAINQVNDLSN
jgi:hypothetical protein